MCGSIAGSGVWYENGVMMIGGIAGGADGAEGGLFTPPPSQASPGLFKYSPMTCTNRIAPPYLGSGIQYRQDARFFKDENEASQVGRRPRVFGTAVAQPAILYRRKFASVAK
jgi:hypothetical protein